MSERMIELRRAQMGLPPSAVAQPATATATTTTTAAAAAAAPPIAQQQVPFPAVPPPAAPRLTPQQVAANTVYSQEENLQKFLLRLHKREEHHTVPMSLSRRMLQRQGVGYLDDNISSLVSATADRFLATVLQQAVTCRDQRVVTGAELAREEGLRRKRHMLQTQADADDRKRRRMERQEAKRKSNLKDIAAAENLRARGLTPATATGGSPSKSKKKKKKAEQNGDLDGDDDASHDSMEEEEDYYKNYYGDHVSGDEDDESDSEEEEEDENQYMLMLRDLERPLEAWDVHLTGKAGLGVVVDDSADEEPGYEGKADEPTLNGVGGPKQDGDDDAKAESQPPSPAKGTSLRSPSPKVASTNKSKSPTPTSRAGRKSTSPGPKGSST